MNAKLKTTLSFFYLLVLFISLNSCYSYRVATLNNDPSTEYESKVIHSFFFGLAQKEINGIHAVAKDCDDLGIGNLSEVKVKNNLLFSLANIVTLGLWCPMKVEWKCAKPCVTN